MTFFAFSIEAKFLTPISVNTAGEAYPSNVTTVFNNDYITGTTPIKWCYSSYIAIKSLTGEWDWKAFQYLYRTNKLHSNIYTWKGWNSKIVMHSGQKMNCFIISSIFTILFANTSLTYAWTEECKYLLQFHSQMIFLDLYPQLVKKNCLYCKHSKINQVRCHFWYVEPFECFYKTKNLFNLVSTETKPLICSPTYITLTLNLFSQQNLY